jgi:hypothetical protein
VAITEGKSDKKIHFGVGNIWIKKDTSLQLATRPDLDQRLRHFKRSSATDISLTFPIFGQVGWTP